MTLEAPDLSVASPKIMKKITRSRSPLTTTIGVAALILFAGHSQATNLYWDADGTTAGASATPTGTWGTSNFWNTDSTGANLGAFQVSTANTDDLFFVAGPAVGSGDTAHTVTVSASQVANSLNFQASGATLISGGTLITLGNGTPGAGGINIPQFAFGSTNNGAVTISTAITLNNAQTWTNNSSSLLTVQTGALSQSTNGLTIDGTGNTTISRVISGSGGLIKSGNGTLVLTTNSTRTGTAQVNAGTLRLQSLTALGTSAVSLTLAGGLLDLRQVAGTGTTGTFGAYNTTVTGNAGIVVSRADNAATAMTATLGTLSIGAQTLGITSGANLNSGVAYGVTFGVTTLTGNATFDVANNGAGVGNLTLGALGDGAVARSIVKQGAGRLTLGTAATSFISSSSIAVQAGLLRLTNATGAGSASINVGASSMLSNGVGTVANSLTLAGGTIGSDGGDRTFGGAVNVTAPSIIRTSDLFVSGTTRSTTLNGQITGSSALDVSSAGAGAGTVTFKNDTSTYNGTITIGANATLTSNPTDGTGSTLGAATINFSANGRTLNIRDNGDGTTNPETLVYANNIATLGGSGPSTLSIDRSGGTGSTKTINFSGQIDIAAATTLRTTNGNAYRFEFGGTLNNNGTLGRTNAHYTTISGDYFGLNSASQITLNNTAGNLDATVATSETRITNGDT